jgi:ankyrin repeat protein/tetratricopeptide (TPR) repeat protein
LCAKVSTSLNAFVVAANNVDSTVQSYRNEVEALSRVLASINTSLQDPLVQSAVRAGRTGHTSGHWRDVKRSMIDCEGTLKNFDRILDRMTRGERGFLSLSRRQIRLDWNSGEITSLKQQIHNYKDTMQVSLQMINLYVPARPPGKLSLQLTTDMRHRCWSLANRASIENLPSKLEAINDKLEIILHSLERLNTVQSSGRTNRDSNSRIMSNLEDCIRSAKAMVPSPSTVLADDSGPAGNGDKRGDAPLNSRPGSTFGRRRWQAIEAWLQETTLEAPPSGVPSLSGHSSSTRQSYLESMDRSSGLTTSLIMNLDGLDSDLTTEVIHSSVRLGKQLFEQEEYTEAEKYLLKALERGEADHDTESDWRIDTLRMLAITCYKQGEWDEAEKYLLELIVGKDETDCRALGAMHMLAEVYMAKENLEKAYQYCHRAVKGRRTALGRDNQLVHQSVSLLADIFEAQGDPVEAAVYRGLLSRGSPEERSPPSSPTSPQGTRRPSLPGRVVRVSTDRRPELSPEVINFIEKREEVEQLCVAGKGKEAARVGIKFLRTLVRQEDTSQDQWHDIEENIVKSKGKGLAGSGHGFAALHLLSSNGLCDFLRELLIKVTKGGINATDRQGWTALHFASLDGHDTTVKLLIEKRATVNAKTKDGCTPLHISCMSGRRATAGILMDGDAEIEARDKDQRTPLYYACKSGDPSIVSLLIERSADIRARTKHLSTPLHISCMNGHLETVELLLKRHPDIEARDQDGRTPLYCACRNGYYKTAKLLLEKHAMLGPEAKDRYTPLHISCLNGYLNIARLLLDRGANIEARTSDKWTPLYCACFNGHQPIAELLLDRGAKLQVEVGDGYTPLHISCQNGHLGIVTLLINRGAEIDAKDHKRPTPLRISCDWGHDDIVQFLIDKGAKVDTKSGNNYTTPLHSACRNGDETVARLLIERGANINARTKLGETPYSLAKNNRRKGVISLLLAKDAQL